MRSIYSTFATSSFYEWVHVHLRGLHGEQKQSSVPQHLKPQNMQLFKHFRLRSGWCKFKRYNVLSIWNTVVKPVPVSSFSIYILLISSFCYSFQISGEFQIWRTLFFDIKCWDSGVFVFSIWLNGLVCGLFSCWQKFDLSPIFICYTMMFGV